MPAPLPLRKKRRKLPYCALDSEITYLRQNFSQANAEPWARQLSKLTGRISRKVTPGIVCRPSPLCRRALPDFRSTLDPFAASNKIPGWGLQGMEPVCSQ
jgi:hypothetical protein